MKYRLPLSAGIAVWAILAVATMNLAQETPEKAIPNYAAKPWTGGTLDDAMRASRSGATIPLSTYSISPTKVKEKKPLTGTIVGSNPFATPATGTTIDAVLVPIIFNIGGTIFDPTAPNYCGVEAGMSAVNSFNASPLVTPVPNFTVNGVNVGTAQYIDGFMRAEFWNATGGNPAYANSLRFTTAAAITITTGANGITTGSGCSLLGYVSQPLLSSQLATQLQALTSSGVISTTKVVFFLINNVLLSPSTPPTTATPNFGYHSVAGSPPQFYAVMDYETTTGAFAARDVSVSAHEIGEFMNDPLGTNQTPPWGGIGALAAGSCQGNFEVGDPMVGIQTPILMSNGYTYHPGELAFFSWFFNSPTTASLGAGGKFSSNGTFSGPSKVCPPGGTY